MSPWLLVAVSYLLGSIPSSYLAGRLARDIDLREHGSGNLGATNTFRVLGAWVAAPVLLFDLAKGWFPAWYFPLWDTAAAWQWALAYGAAAIVGHVFSVFMGFRGGKGVATAAGVFLALAPTAVAAAIVVWILVLLLFRIVSLASISAAVGLVVVLWAVETRAAVVWLGFAIAAFVIHAHRANIRRLLRGEEYRLGRERSTSPSPDRDIA